MNEIIQIEGIQGISHISLPVPDIDVAWEQFRFLGYKEESVGVIEEEEYGIKAKVISKDGVTLELLTPLGDPDKSPYADQLKQKRYCMDHICYEVDNLELVMQQLRKKKFIPISQPRVTVVWNKKAVLLANRKMGVIELLEK